MQFMLALIFSINWSVKLTISFCLTSESNHTDPVLVDKQVCRCQYLNTLTFSPSTSLSNSLEYCSLFSRNFLSLDASAAAASAWTSSYKNTQFLIGRILIFYQNLLMIFNKKDRSSALTWTLQILRK